MPGPKGEPAIRHTLGRVRNLVISGPGDAVIFQGKVVETQLTSREVASFVELWLTYRLRQGNVLPESLVSLITDGLPPDTTS